MKSRETHTRARRRTNEQWSQATSAELRRHARVEFTQRDYAASSLERVAEQAKVTKGAIYYHFGSKEGWFEAVFRDVELEMTNRIHAVSEAAANPIEAVINGSISFLGRQASACLSEVIGAASGHVKPPPETCSDKAAVSAFDPARPAAARGGRTRRHSNAAIAHPSK